MKVEEVTQHCNDRKLAAKAVSEKSGEMFLALFVRQSGPILVDAVIIQVNRNQSKSLFQTSNMLVCTE